MDLRMDFVSHHLYPSREKIQGVRNSRAGEPGKEAPPPILYFLIVFLFPVILLLVATVRKTPESKEQPQGLMCTASPAEVEETLWHCNLNRILHTLPQPGRPSEVGWGMSVSAHLSLGHCILSSLCTWRGVTSPTCG